MAKLAKLLQAAAGAGGGAALNVEDVFSTYLYEGNGTGQAIENGINLGQSYSSGSIRLNEGHINLSSTSVITGDFTIETWAFIEDLPWTYGCFIGSTLASGYNFQFSVDPSNRLRMYNNSIEILGSTTSNQVPLGQWTHLAVTRSSGTHYFFVDGVLKGTTTAGSTTTYRFDQIGAVWDSYYVMQGYMSGARIVNGTALYTSNFTPPTSHLTAVTNTDFLFGQGDTPLVDESTNSVSISNFGTTASIFGPFDAAEAGEGGLVWLKNRTTGGSGYENIFIDSERGVDQWLISNSTGAQGDISSWNISFNSNGWGLSVNNSYANTSGQDYASWTFRKAPKFFDVVTYTGNGTAGRTVSHNLGSVPAVIIVKRTDSTSQWVVYHRSTSANPQNDYLILQTTASAYLNQDLIWNNTAPTSSEFTVGSNSTVNASGGTYVAYLFAHNDGDGEFGPTGDQDIIKCGSFTTNSSGNATVDLGFEPQFVILKFANQGSSSVTASSWLMLDNMRGFTSDGTSTVKLEANSTNPDDSVSQYSLTNTGFNFTFNNSAVGGATYIYIAIRRGPMAVPESGTDVFGMSYAEDAINGTFPVDTVITTALSASDNFIRDRLRGTGHLKTNTNGTEGSGGSIGFDHMTGLDSSGWGTGYIHWLWRRAPKFFDVVCYEGNAVEGHDIPHNLGAVPEMIWVKNRETASQDWYVYHKDVGNTHYFRLNAAGNPVDDIDAWNDTTPTDSVFTVGGAGDVNWNGINHVAYLFASLDGVSKVGSYAGSNSAQTIDCGFSSGARFVLIKNVDTASDWYLYDSERGIVAGNDPFLRLNDTSAQNTATDYIDPDNSGFVINGNIEAVNQSGSDYIFYAIA